MSIIGSNILAGASGQGGGGYTIERSVRLRSSASAYLNRTPASAGNRQKFTISAWIKRGKLASTSPIIGAGATSATEDRLMFAGGDSLLFDGYSANSTVFFLNTTSVYRDSSAWYHIIVAVDTTQSTASNRILMYVNGLQITSFATATYPAQNANLNINNNVAQYLGYTPDPYYADKYLTEVNFIDGQALDPTSFGEYNEDTGVWKPAKYTGSYGTNGFYLDFNDNTTTTTLAEDKSGNNNDWTPNNISLTSGVTYDSMTDTPTIYADGGNYAVLNPLSKGTSQTNVIDGNLYAIPISGASNWGTVFSSIAIPTSGKWYIEATAQIYAGSGNNSSLGVVDSASFIPTNTAILYQYTTGEGFDGILAHLFSDYVSPIADGVQGTNVTGLTGTSINLILALDVDNGKVYAGYNGTWLNSGNPAGNTGEVATRTFSASDVVAGHTSWNGTNDQAQYYNFGQRPFAYTPPDGFKALHTGNLPEPEIVDGSQYFNAVTYTGNGSTQSITGVGFQPDLVWIKKRNSTSNNSLTDVIRGVDKLVFTNSSNAESTFAGGLASFDSNGFSLASNDTGFNALSDTYVAWNWKANGAGVSNTDGSITSTVSANPTAGFSIVTFTGNASGSATVGHGLGVAPDVVIVKRRDVADGWPVYHSSLGANKVIELHSTSGEQASTGYWGLVTSDYFGLSAGGSNNRSGSSNIAYCFSEVEGYSKFGKYIGNGSADGTFVYLGFRPAFVMIKRTDSTGSWQIKDTSRNTSNLADLTLFPNLSNAEYNLFYFYDLLSNGFKVRGTDAELNASGGTYIYMAFAESPFKVSLAR